MTDALWSLGWAIGTVDPSGERIDATVIDALLWNPSQAPVILGPWWGELEPMLPDIDWSQVAPTTAGRWDFQAGRMNARNQADRINITFDD